MWLDTGKGRVTAVTRWSQAHLDRWSGVFVSSLHVHVWSLGHKAQTKLVSYKYGNMEEENYKEPSVNDRSLSFISRRYVTFVKVHVAEMVILHAVDGI